MVTEIGYNWRVKRLRQYLNYRRYSVSKKTLHLIIGFVILIVLVILGTFYFLPRTEWGIKRYYFKQLNKLGSSVESIKFNSEKPNDTKTDLEQYHKTLTSSLDTCKQLDNRYSQVGDRKLGGNLRQSLEGTKKLCDDLVPLLSYSRELHSALKPYLIYDVNAWPPPESEQFSSHLAKTLGMTRSTLSRLKKVEYPKVDDPALSEITQQIEAAEALADEAYTSLSKNETSVATGKTEQLRSGLRQDKTDFLNARHYYWNDTAQIDALQKAITKLRDPLK